MKEQIIEKAIKCPVCAVDFEPSRQRAVSYNVKERDIHKPHSIYFCPGCEVGIAYPSVAEEYLEKFYNEGDYWKKTGIDYISPKADPGHYACAKARWQFVKPLIKKQAEARPVSILDVGAGHGFLGIAAARDLAGSLQKYTTVEVDQTMNASLKKTWNKDFSATHIETKRFIEEVSGEFDLIVLSHILEHLTHPNDLIRKLKSKLSPGGFIFIDVPHQDYRFKEDVFPHVLFFNAESLSKFLNLNGLEIEIVGCYGRPIDKSPLNFKQKGLNALVEKLVYKFRFILPLSFLVKFFDSYFGYSERNVNGTWIRGLAKFNENVKGERR